MASCLDIAAALCDCIGLELRVRGQSYMFVPLGFEKDGEKVAVDIEIEVNDLSDETRHLVEFRSPKFTSRIDHLTPKLLAELRSRSTPKARWKTEEGEDRVLTFYYSISDVSLSHIGMDEFRGLLEKVMDETIALA